MGNWFAGAAWLKTGTLKQRISIIIPVLNEAANLQRLLPELDAQDIRHEVIVVDGGSEDRSTEICRRLGTELTTCQPGRGQQLRTGAELARGDILLFLHADSRIAPGGLRAIRESLQDNPTTVGGNFRLLFDGDDDFCQWLTDFYARIRAQGYYYGDSGIFVRREVYDRLGGIRPRALMEDYDFIRRMERTGPTLCIDAPPLTTSARRFQGRHPKAIVAGWLFIHLLYGLHIPAPLLAKLYRSRNHTPGIRKASSP